MAVPDYVTLSISNTTCCEAGCGAIIIMPADEMERYRDDHTPFYCYKGHNQHFPQKSDKEKLREKLAAAEKREASAKKREEWAKKDLQHEKNSNRALKGVVTRTKNRIKNGVCPCCNRTFKNLADHMKGQHPDYGADE